MSGAQNVDAAVAVSELLGKRTARSFFLQLKESGHHGSRKPAIKATGQDC